MRSPAERDAPPESRHVGLIGGLGVGAAVIYYRAIAAGCGDRGAVPRITIVHAHAPTALAHVGAGRIDELAEYLAPFVAELRSVGSKFFAIPAVTPHIALGPLIKRDSLPIVDMLEVTARDLRERGFSRVALFGTRFTIETALFGALDAVDVIPPRPHEIDEIHRVYLELATAGHTSAAGVKALRDIARAIRRRDHVDAVVLAGTDLNLIFDEASAGFPAFDRAAAHINGDPRPSNTAPTIDRPRSRRWLEGIRNAVRSGEGLRASAPWAAPVAAARSPGARQHRHAAIQGDRLAHRKRARLRRLGARRSLSVPWRPLPGTFISRSYETAGT